MRTTIRIDDELYRRVRQVADRTDRTIGEVIEDAIQLAFRPTRDDQPISDLPVHGGSGVMPGVDLTSNRSIAEAMDEDRALDAMR